MSNFSSDVKDVKSDAKDRLAADFDQLKQNFSQFRDDVSDILKNAVGIGKKNASAVKGQAGDAATTYYGQAKDTYEDYKSRGNQQVEHLGEQIGDHPLAAAAIAFGVGFVVAKLLTKR